MSWRGALVLLLLGAVGVGALVAGPFIYGSVLGTSGEGPEGRGCFLLVAAGLLGGLVAAGVAVLRRRAGERGPEAERLRDALLGDRPVPPISADETPRRRPGAGSPPQS